MLFSGICTALVTPFSNNTVDYDSLEKLIMFQLSNSIKAICLCGTTGEIATLADDEYQKIIKFTKKITQNKVHIMLGVGGNNTENVIKNAKIGKDLGVDSILAVAPYYNKPSQNGLFEHFKLLAKSIDLPIVLYNVPGRTVTDISDDTIAKLAEIENVCALKDASGNLERVAILRSKLIANGCDKKFNIYSGDDITTLGYIAMGAIGTISVASNIMPQECITMCSLAMEGKFAEARILQDKYAKLFDAMFCETNPAPVKYALSKMGMIKNELRLPLVKLSQDSESLINSLISTN